MRTIWLIVAVCLLAGCGIGDNTKARLETAREPQPPEVKITNNPSEARIKAMEARVNLLEAWAVKHGGRFK